jgi:hypothetical protein
LFLYFLMLEEYHSMDLGPILIRDYLVLTDYIWKDLISK